MGTRRVMLRVMVVQACLATALVCLSSALCQSSDGDTNDYGRWMAKPQSEWPQITMINQIEYTDKNHPIAGCGFLLDTGDEVLAAAAKHILKFFKSESMKTVSFGNTLKQWKMFPKDNPADVVVLDQLLNENHNEPLEEIPANTDWLLFTIAHRSELIQPLRFRTTPIQAGEAVYIIGWRYSDKDCPQVIYEGNFVRTEEGSLLISTKELADNTMPGLSGSPVIDSGGYVLGLMSQKAGKLERLSATGYPKMLLAARMKKLE